MKQGQIRVNTENIFPIIKKFLYSEHEIFLRELVSNAVDASQKLKTLANLGEAEGEIGDLAIQIRINKEAKTLTISDKGVGMDAEDVDKYINQVAFSGAEEFVNKYKGQNEHNIIGHFGLGFYSAFMVSDKVVIQTKSFRKDTKAVEWECDGSTSFRIQEHTKESRGTDIILYLNEDSKEFLEAERVKQLLERFCKFLPIPIFFEDVQINDTDPLWVKKPSSLTDEAYKDFYKKLYPFSEAPLFWIHLNVDYPFHLTGILYFPIIKQNYEIQKNKISLYSNQVYVTDDVKNIVPEFLMLLHGVIDSPDIPLNVSRSSLQGDPNLKKINTHITKKVAEKLEEIFKNNRSDYESKWEYINLFVKYGMITDEKFLERAQKILLLQDTSTNKFYSLEELRNETAGIQTNKDNKLVILYATDPVKQDSYIQSAQQKGYKIVKMETIVDAAFINNIELKLGDVQFKRIDSDIADNLIDPSTSQDIVLSEESQKTLQSLFEVSIPKIKLNVEVKGLSPNDDAIIATQAEWMRRMKDMAISGGGAASFYADMPSEVTLTLNGNHPVYQKLLGLKDEEAKKAEARKLVDLALLSQGMLLGADLTNFIKRSIEDLSK